MEKFEFRVDVNTPYMKAIRFIGPLAMGFIIGVNIINYKNGIGINWMSALTGIALGFVFFFFPDKAKKKYLIIDEGGINVHNYKAHWGDHREIKWDNIKSVRIDRNIIHYKNNIGSSDKIPLPFHTKKQVVNLKNYLKELAAVKGIEYLG
ncbi:MAG: hypothetical protein WC967_14535 [Balneolaceae bacterium]